MSQDHLSSEVIEAIKKFQPIRNKVRKIRNKLDKEYDWENSDIRIGAFEQIDNLIYSLNLSSAVSIRGFSDTNWIENQLFRNKSLSHEEKLKNFHAARINLHSFHRISFIYCLTQVAEGVIRSIARKVVPNENGNGKFGPLCKKLSNYLEHPEKITPEMRNALNLLREIRNTIHNNGFSFGNKSDKNSHKIKYRGKEYNFYTSKPHNHATYLILAQITEDIAELVKTIVFDPDILELESLPGTTSNVFDRFSA